MRFSSRQVFGAVLVLVTGNAAFMAWRTLSLTLQEQGIGDLWMPFLWFSILAVFFIVGMIAWSGPWQRIAGTLALFLPSLFFVQTLVHAAALLVASLLAYAAARAVQEELRERLRFRFAKSVRAGQGIFLFALVLSLSSFYYAEIRGASWEALVPRFHVGEGTTRAIFKMIGNINPEFAELKEEGITVDDFLESIRRNGTRETSGSPDGPIVIDPSLLSGAMGESVDRDAVDATLRGLTVSPQSEAVIRELSLRSGREQLARLAGREVRGDEKVSDVFSYAVQQKIIATLSAQEAGNHLAPQVIPLFLAVLLFLTLLPLASILMYVWIPAAHLIFFLALSLRWLRLDRVASEQQVLEP